jgi:hypothetical protein
MQRFVFNADLPLDAMYANAARPDGQDAPGSKDIVGTENKLEGRVALRPQDVPPVADNLPHQLDATQTCAGLR